MSASKIGFVLLIPSLIVSMLMKQDVQEPDVIPKKEAVLTVAQALESIGKPSVQVELTVQTAKNRLDRRGIVFLDSEEDFGNEKNLGIAISVDAAAQMKEKGIDDPAEYYKDKRIRVTGPIMRFEDRPYLPVMDAKQIEEVGE